MAKEARETRNTTADSSAAGAAGAAGGAGTDADLVLGLASAWGALERRLTGALSNIRGISLAEYRLLRALDQAGGSSRVELARAVGLTPSAVTRAIRPLEDLGMIKTVKNERDARLALATLTADGSELVDDATGVLNDAMVDIIESVPTVSAERALLRKMCAELARL